MRKTFSLLLALLLTLALVAAGCGNDDDSDSAPAPTEAPATEAPTEAPAPEPTEAPEPEPTEAPAPEAPSGALITLDEECAAWGGLQAPDGFRVNMVTDIGKVDDGTFNQFAYEGMTGAAECLRHRGHQRDRDRLRGRLRRQPEHVGQREPRRAHHRGASCWAPTRCAAAEENPGINYIGIDQWQPAYPDNYVGVLFNEHEGGFIAGALAASLSESGVVGVVAGREGRAPGGEVRQRLRGRRQAHQPPISRCCRCTTRASPTRPRALPTLSSFIGDGADVIFGAGGPTGSGGVKAAAEASVWGIGVDQDEYYTTFNGGSAPWLGVPGQLGHQAG